MVTKADECFSAAAGLFSGILGNITDSSKAEPSGCFVLAKGNGFEAHFNTQALSMTPCGAGTGPVRASGSEQSDVFLHLDLDSGTAKANVRWPQWQWV